MMGERPRCDPAKDLHVWRGGALTIYGPCQCGATGTPIVVRVQVPSFAEASAPKLTSTWPRDESSTTP